ncbi:hypothetical protein F0562_003004 [Nyssa sinensis]|uniref:Uncharacterized protein n=1 Tax=Nyssa sinensis TaxID=561372 RepID=A0A5J5BX36_9ASTE|nr:hypothetical protein F0562_003004 [Nyssa sinensis]
MLNESSIRVDGREGVVDVQAHPTDTIIPKSVTDTSSHDPSRFDLSLPKIKDEGDLTAFIAKYQDAFPENVIVNLGGEESLGILCSSKDFIKFHLLVIALGFKFPIANFYRQFFEFFHIAPSQFTPNGYRILIGFQALIRIYKFRLGFNEFRASYIVKWMGNKCCYISHRNMVLIQYLPQSEKDRDLSRLLDPNGQWAEVPTINIVESGLHRIPVGIPFRSYEYSHSYSLDRHNSPRVPIKRRILDADGRMTEVTVMVRLVEAPPSSTMSIVERFSRSIPSLTGISRKRVTQGTEDPKRKRH